ncbi:hypothetical protein [Janthinobacterium sp. PC23-8]|uniref:hypothetical protein n=1 Tax=Janthinobacterium sp. PC23-8 TaxID=2012679 RepID=UPI00113FD7B1|nr:hypothetical protein [Janthinobacterium sp. PC23-8]
MTLVKQRRNAQQQLSLSGFGDATAVFHDVAAPRSADERGAIFTRRVVVDFILDLVGYTVDMDLHETEGVKLFETVFVNSLEGNFSCGLVS